jgi:hypothetical protein
MIALAKITIGIAATTSRTACPTSRFAAGATLSKLALFMALSSAF